MIPRARYPKNSGGWCWGMFVVVCLRPVYRVRVYVCVCDAAAGLGREVVRGPSRLNDDGPPRLYLNVDRTTFSTGIRVKWLLSPLRRA